jgi:AraC-like DNA-binding protein
MNSSAEARCQKRVSCEKTLSSRASLNVLDETEFRDETRLSDPSVAAERKKRVSREETSSPSARNVLDETRSGNGIRQPGSGVAGETQKSISREETSSPPARWWRLPDPGAPELLRACYRHRTFARHSHDRFALGVIEGGALSFHYRGQEVLAPAGWVNLAYPGEAHTGRAASTEGWRYRMFYLDPELLLEAARALDPDHHATPFIPAGAVWDPELAQRISCLHRFCEDPCSEPLTRQAGLGEVLRMLVARHGSDQPISKEGRDARAIALSQDFIQAHHAKPIQLAKLAAISGLNPYRLVRCFTRELGMPPHAYLVQTRLHHATRLLRQGISPARAAAESGFADQSHLHRHFVKSYGVTPGMYQHKTA